MRERYNRLYNRKAFIRWIVLAVATLTTTQLFAQPAITAITPASAAVGATVIIKGANFDPTPANNIVYFGPVRAVVTAASPTALNVVIPTGARHAAVTITAGNATAYSAVPYNIISGNVLTAASFSVKNDFATTGSFSSGIVSSDFDGDGRPDLVISNFLSSDVSVFKNRSTAGTVAFDPVIKLAAGVETEGMAIGDMNNDGKPDLAVASISGHMVCLFINTSTAGQISFAPRADIPTGAYSWPRGIALYDMDGDGRTDLCVADNNKIIEFSNGTITGSHGTISLFRNTGSAGTYSFDPPVVFTMVDYPRKLSVGDLDGDGKPDLVVASQVSHGIYIFKNTGTPGIIGLAAPLHFNTGVNTEQSAIGDLDGDGRPDIVVTDLTSSAVTVFRNTSSAGTIALVTAASKTAISPIGIALGDLDGDGRPDMAAANAGSTTVSVWKNTSSVGAVSFGPAFNYTSGNLPTEVSIGDIDGDGRPDLSLSVGNDNKVTVLTPPVAAPKINLGVDTTLCEGDSLKLTVFIAGAAYQWNTGETGTSITVKAAGTYWVKAAAGNFLVSDTVLVAFRPRPAVTLGSDALLCDGEKKVLHAGTGNTGYLWQDGSAADSMVVTKGGLYWLQVLQNGCTGRDSVTITYTPLPPVNIGRDTAICSGASIDLDASAPGTTTYTWQDGSTTARFRVQQPGTYWVVVKGPVGCVNRDTVKVFAKALPVIKWGTDTMLCSGPLVLSPVITGGTWVWQDGSAGPAFSVQQPGTYSVQASNVCGTVTGNINITKGMCELLMPNAFTPNNDGKNDVFRLMQPQTFSSFKMEVINRWGEVVYSSADPYKGWDGRWKGVLLPAGNYVWIIALVDAGGRKQSHSGNVVLIR